MPILGRAIGNELVQTRGLYSVELPAQLEAEMKDLVATVNAIAPQRAVLVYSGELAPPIVTVAANAILKWRTDDDRIFVWPRGAVEPDSSFRSVVKPYISSRFPGVEGGECTVPQLAALVLREIWRSHSWEPGGHSFEAFVETAEWVGGVLQHAFEHSSSFQSHWSDEFLVHWAEVFADLAGRLNGFAIEPDERHAWELVRLAGIPVPVEAAHAANPFAARPDRVESTDWKALASLWNTVVNQHVLEAENRPVLQAALDRFFAQSGRTNSWRDLDWGRADLVVPDAVGPVAGRAVFSSPSAPSVLTEDVVVYPDLSGRAWWGVTTGDLQNALRGLEKSRSFVPTPDSTRIQRIGSGPDSIHLIKSRGSPVRHSPTPKSWRCEIEIDGLSVSYSEIWNRVHLAAAAPAKDVSEGDVWIRPDDIELTSGSNTRVDLVGGTIRQNRLDLSFTLQVVYKAKRDSSTDEFAGSWNPNHNIRFKARVRDYGNGQWGSPRSVNASLRVLVPSPFAPTVMISKFGALVVGPDRSDQYTSSQGAPEWAPEPVPDVLLQEEGTHLVTVYDGCLSPLGEHFAPLLTPRINGESLEQDGSVPELWRVERNLYDSDNIEVENRSRDVRDLATVRIAAPAGTLTCGVLAAVLGKPAEHIDPPSSRREQLLGRCQDSLTQAISALGSSTPDSLFQFIAATAAEPIQWSPHPGSAEPHLLYPTRSLPELPRLGNGPSDLLRGSSEWRDFMLAAQDVFVQLGIVGAGQRWLSTYDPSVLSVSSVRRYVDSHRALARVAKQLSDRDGVWASYPMSVFVVESAAGPSTGEVRAILLSPLHPARLAWTFALAYAGRMGGGSPEVLGLAEGWNIPFTGSMQGPTGLPLALVAVPVDPGAGEDFIGWSALGVLTEQGLVNLPSGAAGLSLPWGGRTGINDNVVRQSITDFLRVHPHLTTLELDIRSVSPSPRSREIDEAVLGVLGGTSVSEAEGLLGSMRVWDSENRQGKGPTRESLFAVRGEENGSSSKVEWRVYPTTARPPASDLAIVESSSVHLAPVAGKTDCVLGTLPIRRFCPVSLDDNFLEQNYSALVGDDLLGLAGLLAEIEHHQPASHSAMRGSPQAMALGLETSAKWQVVGSFHMDPSLLTSMLASQGSANPMVLWEWRPSWLSRSKKGNELTKRPYYVIARVPASLQTALKARQRLSPSESAIMLTELGRRGIGLASLNAKGGSQESAALGFFYSLRLLAPVPDHPLRAAWLCGSGRAKDDCVYGLVPLDPIHDVLEALSEISNVRRTDLLVFRANVRREGPIRICFVPVEVKHHGHPGSQVGFPGNNDGELTRAREQLTSTKDVLGSLLEDIFVAPDADLAGSVRSYAKRVGLATVLDLALGLAPVPPPAAVKAQIIRGILDGTVEFGIGDGLVMWFAAGASGSGGAVCRKNPHAGGTQQEGTQELFIDPLRTQGLWWDPQSVQEADREVRAAFDALLEDCFDGCEAQFQKVGTTVRDQLRLQMLSPADRDSDSSITAEDRPQIAVEDEDTTVVFREEQAAAATEDTSEESAAPETQQLAEAPVEGLEERAGTLPQLTAGWGTLRNRWNVVGKLKETGELIALDLDEAKAIGVYGYMGSGKSYLLGVLTEGATAKIPGINALEHPLAVVVFNYRRIATDRFELASLAYPNANETDVEKLRADYGAFPREISDISVVYVPGELKPQRQAEYGALKSHELFFDPERLTVEDWELLMGDPGSEAVFARTIRSVLFDLHAADDVSLESLETQVMNRLTGASKSAAQLRFEFVRRHLSEQAGIDFRDLVRPGRVTVIDLRHPLFTKESALRFFLVCANQISQLHGFNKMIVFDEAHEYLSDAFGDKLESRIRQMRHEGTSYIFATQDVNSIPLSIRRFITTNFVFNLGTRENVEDLLRSNPEFKDLPLTGMPRGMCLMQSGESTDQVFGRPRKVLIRPRVTQHGGATRVYLTAEGDEAS